MMIPLPTLNSKMSGTDSRPTNTSIFRDPKAISIVDEAHSENEERWLTMGLDDSGILLVVSHTFKMVDTSTYEIRIISARKADKSEIKQYQT